jgi:dTDP-glucose 4,6-dehydratase/UDP-glucose 4-epimerase
LKLLILGSEGFIGSHLVTYFNAANHAVFGCDLFEKPSGKYNYIKVVKEDPILDALFKQEQFDVCINAGGSGNVSSSMTEPFKDFRSNSLDTIYVLESIRLFAPSCKYLHISSAAVYGNPPQLPVKETDSLHPLSPYGWHKLIAEHLCLEYSTVFNIRTAAVRPFSVFGPGLRKQLFWDLYQKALRHSGSVELWGTGNESRDFIYIDDLIKIIDIIIRKADMKGETYNAGTGTETTIKTIAELFFRQLDPSIEIVSNGMVRPGDPLNWRADIGRMENLGFIPEKDIAAGMKKLTTWMKSLS